MGNIFHRENAEIIEEPEPNNDDNNDEQRNDILATGLKTIIKIKNPFYLLKETMHLEKDSIKNIYYIKFNYDSLIKFNCYINFNVRQNLQRNNLKQNNDYELCFIPTDNFVEKNIVIDNLPSGKNQSFFDKNAFLDFDYFEKNTTRRKDEYDDYEEEEEEEDDDDDVINDNNNNDTGNINNNNNNNNNNNESVQDSPNIIKQNEENETLINTQKQEDNNDENKDNNNNNNNEPEEYEEIFDIGIEFIPYYDKNADEFEQNKDNNEIVFISLFNIEKKENNEIDIKCVSQILKKHNYNFELKDIYDDTGNNGKCVICYTNNRDTIFLPCRHSSCCHNCSGTLKPKICPLCKNIIQDIICLDRELSKIYNKNEVEKDNNITNENEEGAMKNTDNAPVQSINES